MFSDHRADVVKRCGVEHPRVLFFMPCYAIIHVPTARLQLQKR